jgi:hypothetical protein
MVKMNSNGMCGLSFLEISMKTARAFYIVNVENFRQRLDNLFCD